MNADLIKKLAEKRKQLEDLRTERAAILRDVTESPKFKKLEELIRTLGTQLDTLDSDIRVAALDQYALDPSNKKIGNGIEIKVFKVATILDPEHAREWCLTNFRPALKLDESMLKKTAIEGAIPASVVAVTEEPRAQIASDLSEFLPDPLICQTTGKPVIECTCDEHQAIPF